MKILPLTEKKEFKRFKRFRRDLYRKDPYYVSTAEFTLDMLLYRQTDLAASIEICPVMGVEGKKILLEALLIHNPKDSYLQIAFFEALENIPEEVRVFMDYAADYAKKRGLHRIVIGLNGHLSYGVGLSVDMKRPNTFDSTYTKPYYNSYFEGYRKHGLVAFSSTPDDILPHLSAIKSDITVRKIDLDRFEEETELFRRICDETIGTTFLYTKTDKGHFYSLLKDMTFFLKPENILFAEHRGEVVGFLFWHPDYNEILKKGRHNSLFTIAVRYLLLKDRIKRAKLNAMGVKREYRGVATARLLYEASRYLRSYEVIETNFVWQNNKSSMALNRYVMKNEERHFAVYEVEV